jgi:hypothetical protein
MKSIFLKATLKGLIALIIKNWMMITINGLVFINGLK